MSNILPFPVFPIHFLYMQQTAVHIVKILQKAGYTAYFAGGAVRDILLGNDPVDIDIATSAKPDEIEHLFEKTFSIGKHFGVILVEENGHHFEIATFRSDAGYSDGRRPDAVLFTNAEEDALRRDFTINGMFFDPIEKKIYDFVGGQKDLDGEVLRFIGDAEQRIQEDHLRILRAIRFKNRFHLRFGKKTEGALKRHASLIVGVSAERVREEMTKMLLHSSRKNAFEDLLFLTILEHIIPTFAELNKIPQPKNYHSEGDVLTHSLLVISQLPKKINAELAWSALLHDIGKKQAFVRKSDRIHFPRHAEMGEEMAKKVLRKLKFSKFSESKIRWLIRYHHLFDSFDEMKWVTKLHYYDHPFFEDLMELHRADMLGCVPLDPHFHVRGLQHLKQIREEYEKAEFENLLPSAQEEFLTGEEIMKILDLKPGKKVGEIKSALRDAQLDGEVRSKKEAEEWIRGKSMKKILDKNIF